MPAARPTAGFKEARRKAAAMCSNTPTGGFRGKVQSKKEGKGLTEQKNKFS